MSTQEEAQKYLDYGMVRVTDEALVRQYIPKADATSEETYNNLIRVIAETGCLLIAFRDLPEVRKLLEAA